MFCSIVLTGINLKDKLYLLILEIKKGSIIKGGKNVCKEAVENRQKDR